MSRGHWLDPFARQLLRLTGQLPNQKKSSKGLDTVGISSIQIEQTLQELKLKQKSSIPISTFSVDVNRATTSDWYQLPGCTVAMAELLVKLQKGGVQLSGPEDLFQVLELPEDLANKWRPHLVF